MWFPSSLFATHTICFLSHLFFLSFGDVNKLKKDIFSKLEYYYILQVYWDFAEFGLANWARVLYELTIQ
jgi:hypothetical protein